MDSRQPLLTRSINLNLVILTLSSFQPVPTIHFPFFEKIFCRFRLQVYESFNYKHTKLFQESDRLATPQSATKCVENSSSTNENCLCNIKLTKYLNE